MLTIDSNRSELLFCQRAFLLLGADRLDELPHRYHIHMMDAGICRHEQLTADVVILLFAAAFCLSPRLFRRGREWETIFKGDNCI